METGIMTINYVEGPPEEDGIYLVEEDGKLTVAEYDARFEDWRQLGIDYDVWQYSGEKYTIKVIRKLDLKELANVR